MDPGKRLDAGEAAAAEGRYEDALREYTWFHEHALTIEPAYYGVRLSFALSSWVELGRKYPPALEALRSVRDAKTDVLSAGEGTRQLFHDVASINDHLGDTSRTHWLFQRLVERAPELAKSCADLALPPIVDSKDFELAARFLPPIDSVLDKLARRLNAAISELQEWADTSSPSAAEDRRAISSAESEYYADRLRLLLLVLSNTGRQADAARLRVQAIAAVADDAVREQVRRLLTEGS